MVSAQDMFPSRVIRIVTPATGGGSDVLARMIAPALTESLAQQVIVDNRGSLATELVAEAPEEFAVSMKNDTARKAKLVKDAGICFE